MANGWGSTHHLFSRLNYWAATTLKVSVGRKIWYLPQFCLVEDFSEIFRYFITLKLSKSKYCWIIHKTSTGFKYFKPEYISENNKSNFNLKVGATCDMWGVMSLLQFKCEKFSRNWFGSKLIPKCLGQIWTVKVLAIILSNIN